MLKRNVWSRHRAQFHRCPQETFFSLTNKAAATAILIALFPKGSMLTIRSFYNVALINLAENNVKYLLISRYSRFPAPVARQLLHPPHLNNSDLQLLDLRKNICSVDTTCSFVYYLLSVILQLPLLMDLFLYSHCCLLFLYKKIIHNSNVSSCPPSADHVRGKSTRLEKRKTAIVAAAAATLTTNSHIQRKQLAS